MPSFPDQQSTEEGTSSGFEVLFGMNKAGSVDSSNLWMDEDARSFYESLPDLKASMPGVSNLSYFKLQDLIYRHIRIVSYHALDFI